MSLSGTVAERHRLSGSGLGHAVEPLHCLVGVGEGPAGATVVDIVGTGGDDGHTVNVSTMAAIVLAATGTRVVKHGGRSVSSQAGSADVLEKVGIPLDLGPEQVTRCVDEVGIGFTFAPSSTKACATPPPCAGSWECPRPSTT